MPNPADIDRAPATERANRMPMSGGTSIDPKKLVGLAAAAGAVMFTVLALGSGFTGSSTPRPLKPKPALEPAQYDPKTVIAPTLATASTDPNAPIALRPDEVPAIQGVAAQPPMAMAQQAQASPGQTLREAARRSTLVAYGGQRDSALLPVSEVRGGSDADFARGTEREPTALETLRHASVIGQVRARVLPDRDFILTAGTFIPCVLQSAMDSNQPGIVTCIIPRNVYSDNGRVVLMEKGTKVFGEYQGGLNRGQYRLFVLWSRAITPRGVAIDVGSPATDAVGRSGLGGRVDNFFWQRFGTALLFSVVEDAATLGTQAAGDRGANTARVPSDAASTVLQQNGEIRPVLRKNQGEDVGITVAQDFDFSSVYGLTLR